MGRFSLLDCIILATYMLGSLLLGVWFTRRQKSIEDYFVARRAAPWWAVGISIIATDLSAISYLGHPAWVFQHDLQLGMGIFLFPLCMILIVYLFVPFMARMRLYTIYEYLERRFSRPARKFASAMFLLLRGGWIANAIYVQGIALSEIAGMQTVTAIWLIGGVSAIYTVLGGMEAVLWTDVMQFFVLVGGIAVMCIAVVIPFHGDVAQMWHLAAQGGHTRMVSFDLNPKLEVTFWSLLIGTIVLNISAYGSDQVIVQRYFTTKSKSEMANAVLFNGVLVIPVVLGLYFAGIGFSAYYATHQEMSRSLTDPSRVVPHFITHVLPNGLSGLVIAGIFAATMSSLSAGFNSLSTATYIDFHRGRDTREEAISGNGVTANLRAARWWTLAWGFGATIAAMFVGRLGGIMQISYKINGFFSGPLVGMFLLGLLTRRANTVGVISGAIIGTIMTWMASTTGISWLWYSPVGCGATMLSGYIISFMSRATSAEKIQLLAGSDV